MQELDSLTLEMAGFGWLVSIGLNHSEVWHAMSCHAPTNLIYATCSVANWHGHYNPPNFRWWIWCSTWRSPSHALQSLRSCQAFAINVVDLMEHLQFSLNYNCGKPMHSLLHAKRRGCRPRAHAAIDALKTSAASPWIQKKQKNIDKLFTSSEPCGQKNAILPLQRCLTTHITITNGKPEEACTSWALCSLSGTQASILQSLVPKRDSQQSNRLRPSSLIVRNKVKQRLELQVTL